MTNWATYPLGELVDSLDSRRVPVSAAERAKRPGTVPYYGAAGPVGVIDRALFDEPLLLLGEDGVGFFDTMKAKAYLIDGPAWVNNHAHVLRVRPCIERRFLLYFLNHFNYLGYANGTTRLKLTKSAMNSIPLPVPELDEQRRIVDILEDHLSRLDAAEAELLDQDRRCSLLDQVVLRARLDVMSSAPRARLADVMEPQRRIAYGVLVPGPDTSSGVPMIRVGDLLGTDVARNVKKISPAVEAKFPRTRLRGGEVLLSVVGTIGRTGIVPAAMAGANVARAVSVLPVGSHLSAEYLALVLQGPAVQRKLSSAAHEVARKTLNLEDVRAIEIPVPDRPTQDAVVRELLASRESSLRMRNQITSALRRSKVLRQSLLEAAFSGRLTGSNT